MAVKGLERLTARLARVGAACEAAGAQALAQAAEQARAEAAALAPVDTGHLRDSLRAEAAGNAASVSADCEYAAAVELGSRGRAARPFLYPAAQTQAAALPAQAAELARRAMR